LISVHEIEIGTGEVVREGDLVEVGYRGTFPDGRLFDDGAFEFTLGAGMVIGGFDLGVLGMRVGGQRKITVPPELGYGERGAPPSIPSNATLVFEVTVLGLRRN
jgi:peptidylprolyl isomerase/FKBP-type peptidyl-prolyl cis-trans isomerase FkpA